MALTTQTFSYARLSQGIQAVDTKVRLESRHGARFPQTGQFAVVLWREAYQLPYLDPNREVVYLTLDSGDVFTAVRGRAGTTAQEWEPNTIILLMVLDAVLDENFYVSNTDRSPVEVPNGILTQFSTSEAFIAGSLNVYVNGVLQEKDVDYAEDVGLQSYTFTSPPLTGWLIEHRYRVTPS